MGAGNYAAGQTPAGYDAFEPETSPNRRVKPPAIRYDGASRNYLLDANGRYLPVHPVDQRVALKLLTRQGALKSVPTLGSRFHLIPLDDRAQAAALNETNRILGPDVVAGDIRILSVEARVSVGVTGGLSVAVSYLNLRIAAPDVLRTRTVSVT